MELRLVDYHTSGGGFSHQTYEVCVFLGLLGGFSCWKNAPKLKYFWLIGIHFSKLKMRHKKSCPCGCLASHCSCFYFVSLCLCHFASFEPLVVSLCSCFEYLCGQITSFFHFCLVLFLIKGRFHLNKDVTEEVKGIWILSRSNWVCSLQNHNPWACCYSWCST